MAYSADGTQIAVGLGGGTKEHKQKKDGAFIILNEEDLTIIHEARDSKQVSETRRQNKTHTNTNTNTKQN